MMTWKYKQRANGPCPSYSYHQTTILFNK